MNTTEKATTPEGYEVHKVEANNVNWEWCALMGVSVANQDLTSRSYSMFHASGIRFDTSEKAIAFFEDAKNAHLFSIDHNPMDRQKFFKAYLLEERRVALTTYRRKVS